MLDQYIFPLLSVLMVLISLFSFQPRFIVRKHALRDALANPDTRECTRQYRRSLYRTVIILTVLILPNALIAYALPLYFSLSLVYMLVWVMAWMYLFTFRLVPRYLARLWSIQNRHVNAAQTPPRFVNQTIKIGAGVATAVMLAAVFLALYTDFGSMSVSFRGDMVSIKAPLFSCTFSKNDMLSVTKTNALPRAGKKIVGSGTPKNAYGRFSFDGIGNAELFVNHGVKPIIVIALKDKTVFLNGTTPEETEFYYTQLTASE